MATLESRIAHLEKRAAGVNQCRFCGVMTPEQWLEAASRGFIEWDGNPISGGVFIIAAVMEADAWERAAIEHHEALIRLPLR
jgi:hypothetical protein